jgi:hypothetical protein
MSDFIIPAVTIFIAAFAAIVYIVMAWPFFLAVAAVWMLWKLSRNGQRLGKIYIEKKLKQIPNFQ